MEKTNIK